jgi:hypothetical protein
MDEPFRFKTRLNLVEMLGRSARNVSELQNGIREVPGSSIYYHTHRFLQQHHYLYPEPPNDFAFWVTQALRLEAVGEKLASVDTVKYVRVNDLRDRYEAILQEICVHGECSGDCRHGEEFHFMSCRTFILPTPFSASTLEEFRDALKKISINSLYFHMFEARLRLGQDTNDFSRWLSSLGYVSIARGIARLDPYTITLEGLRQKIVAMVE